MAQLRDAGTSALVAEGTRLELALIADAIGREQVLFDDVGAAFELDVELAGHAAHVAALEAASARIETRSLRLDVERELQAREQLVADALARVDEVRAALAAVNA